ARERVRAATISGSLVATAALGLAAGAGPAEAAGGFDASLVKDINPSGSNDVRYLAAMGGTVFFRANDGIHGSELWRSDGTEAGTYMVKDINPNGANSTPADLTVVGNTLFFSAYDGTQGGGPHGVELWKSDGTEGGTQLVEDIYSGSTSSNPRYLTNVGGTLFFSAFDGPQGGGTHRRELWKSTEGTAANPDLVEAIDLSSGSYPYDLTNVGGPLFFRASDGPEPTQHGQELWKSTDGTADNTELVEDINTAGESTPHQLTNVGGTLFFAADDGTHGVELWRSTDGTPANTDIVRAINDSGDSDPYYLTDFGGTLFFSAYDGAEGGGTHGTELWKSTGTDLGT